MLCTAYLYSLENNNYLQTAREDREVGYKYHEAVLLRAIYILKEGQGAFAKPERRSGYGARTVHGTSLYAML